MLKKDLETVPVEVSKIEELIMETEQVMVESYEQIQKNKTFKVDESTKFIHSTIQRLKTIQSELRDLIEEDPDY